MVLYVTCEYFESSFIGSAATFQIIRLHDANDTDYTFLVDPEKRYVSFADARDDIAVRLDLDPRELELEEV